MTVTATDVISDDDVRAVLEERTQAMYQFRRAFREDDASDVNGGSKTFPQASTNLRGDMVEVAEDANYPRSTLAHEGITANYTKDGFEVAISDEAANDTPVNVILDITEEMAVAAEHRLDAQAYATLDLNRSATEIGVGTEDLNFQAIVDAYVELADNEFNPADFEVYCSPQSWGNLATDSNFNRATDEGDNLARNGMLAEVFGTNVALSNTGSLGATEAIMVDTGRYGYESTMWDREVSNYREDEADRDVFKIRHRKDFVPMKPEAAIKILGGVV